MTIIEFAPPKTGRHPAWARTAFVDDDGRLFLPASVVGNERSVMLCASFDNVPVMRDRGHLYAPCDWLVSEYPAQAEAIRHIQQQVAAFETIVPLQSCPFCGSGDVFESDAAGGPSLAHTAGEWSVECASCTAVGPVTSSRNDAREAWNSRR